MRFQMPTIWKAVFPIGMLFFLLLTLPAFERLSAAASFVAHLDV
jgi:hypothetical protein